MDVRPFTPPFTYAPELPQQRHIIIRHPGYDDMSNVLLRLFAPDAPSSSSSASFGLHAGFALTACGIVAGNRWDGWLSEHKHDDGGQDDPARIALCAADWDKMLDKDSYYFHLPYDNDDDNNPSPYPIVPTFQEWAFPHNQLPSSWTHIALPEAYGQLLQTHTTPSLNTVLLLRDEVCAISGCLTMLQTAHVCPKAEEEWYLRNGMSRYCSRRSAGLEDPVNVLRLRADLHIAFDKPYFVFVPKADGVGSQQFVLHVVEPCVEYQHLYHNQKIQQQREVCVELLFARFAWTIFPLVADFLKGKVRRRLRLMTTSKDDGTKVAPFFASAEQCENLVMRRSKSRNTTSKKRARLEDSAQYEVTDASLEDSVKDEVTDASLEDSVKDEVTDASLEDSVKDEVTDASLEGKHDRS
ncbi:hypothetical protein G3M48_006098 [Beauveria asiatica]|uniref:HNH nuclease domain-containing protein n=1 Tax=Beauveria asiatica TaxID=1069075 RepID=A0AAW0S5Z3_9HYPO